MLSVGFRSRKFMRIYLDALVGHAPKSEPFRQWIANEVLLSIRKTGSYNAAEK